MRLGGGCVLGSKTGKAKWGREREGWIPSGGETKGAEISPTHGPLGSRLGDDGVLGLVLVLVGGLHGVGIGDLLIGDECGGDL